MTTKKDVTNHAASQQQVSTNPKSYLVNVKLKNEENTQSNSKIGTYERDPKTPNKDAHSDTKTKR